MHPITPDEIRAMTKHVHAPQSREVLARLRERHEFSVDYDKDDSRYTTFATPGHQVFASLNRNYSNVVLTPAMAAKWVGMGLGRLDPQNDTTVYLHVGERASTSPSLLIEALEEAFELALNERPRPSKV